jgi:hypothetical protein
VNRTTYGVLAAYAGAALSASCPWPVTATTPFPMDANPAVYVAIGIDGRCCYVGSVARQGETGLADRIAAHLRQPHKARTWQEVWVLPLLPGTPRSEVRRIEGVVGAHLGPKGSVRLPILVAPRAGSANQLQAQAGCAR